MSDERDLQVRAWMNAPEFTVRPEATVEDAFATMRREDIRHLLVVDADDTLVGVVTDRDLRRPDGSTDDLMSVRAMYVMGDDLKVADVMTSDPMVVAPDDLTAQAAKIMVENKFSCLPVVADDEVVGIITTTDLLAALVNEMDPVAIEAREAG